MEGIDPDMMEAFTQPWIKDQSNYEVYILKIRTKPEYFEAITRIAMMATPNPILTKKLTGKEKKEFMEVIKQITSGWEHMSKEKQEASK